MLFRVAAVLSGLVGALAPEWAVGVMAKATLLGWYENPEDLRPREWVVDLVRLQSALLALAGAVGIALEFRKAERAARAGARADGE
jgi:hypothetical protein